VSTHLLRRSAALAPPPSPNRATLPRTAPWTSRPRLGARAHAGHRENGAPSRGC
jgi:hypothetical protein